MQNWRGVGKEMSKKHELKLVTLMGTPLPKDKNLARRLKKQKSITGAFREISAWEKESIKEFRDRERTSKSGKLTIG
jgi:hypothetical protein